MCQVLSLTRSALITEQHLTKERAIHGKICHSNGMLLLAQVAGEVHQRWNDLRCFGHRPLCALLRSKARNLGGLCGELRGRWSSSRNDVHRWNICWQSPHWAGKWLFHYFCECLRGRGLPRPSTWLSGVFLRYDHGLKCRIDETAEQMTDLSW